MNNNIDDQVSDCPACGFFFLGDFENCPSIGDAEVGM